MSPNWALGNTLGCLNRLDWGSDMFSGVLRPGQVFIAEQGPKITRENGQYLQNMPDMTPEVLQLVYKLGDFGESSPMHRVRLRIYRSDGSSQPITVKCIICTNIYSPFEDCWVYAAGWTTDADRKIDLKSPNFMVQNTYDGTIL